MGSITRSIANNLTAGLGGAEGINFRNMIINGDCSVAQRSTSVTGKTGSGIYTVDRMALGIDNLGTWTVAQETLTSGAAYNAGFKKAFRIDCTTADASPAASDNIFFQYKIEGSMLQSVKKGTPNAEYLTLTFWVKSNKTGTGQVLLQDKDNNRNIGKTYTISSADTWEKKTLTFDPDTTGAFDDDNNKSFELEWALDAGSDFTGGTLPSTWTTGNNNQRSVNDFSLGDSTDNDWAITGIQLEIGETATDFEFLPRDVNLNRCQRYYQFEDGTLGNGGQSYATASLDFSIAVIRTFSPEMRAAPTATIGGVNAIYDSSGTSQSANINRVSKTMWSYGRKRTGSGNAVYGVEFSDISYEAEL